MEIVKRTRYTVEKISYKTGQRVYLLQTEDAEQAQYAANAHERGLDRRTWRINVRTQEIMDEDAQHALMTAQSGYRAAAELMAKAERAAQTLERVAVEIRRAALYAQTAGLFETRWSGNGADYLVEETIGAVTNVAHNAGLREMTQSARELTAYKTAFDAAWAKAVESGAIKEG